MVKIVTDSSCDISPQRCAELGVEMLPITVNFGGESYRANLDISNEEFYEKLAAAEELPHTAQITPAQFQEIFKPYQESGDDVVCLFISSQMSGTLQSARVAANILGADNILLPDTLHVTFALGLLVEEAVKMRDAGLSGKEIVARIEELIPRVRLFAMIEDLKYLKMGGRLSATSALVASILGIWWRWWARPVAKKPPLPPSASLWRRSPSPATTASPWATPMCRKTARPLRSTWATC